MNIHNTMTKCAALLLGGAAIFASCTDLSGIEERIDSLDSRVTALENQVASFNESLTAINGLLEDGTVITSITETENGYTFTASNGETYTITNGTAGNTPLVRIDAEGNWEVSYDDGDSYDDIMVDENTPASAQGIAPQFQVSEDGYWQVSTDGGSTFSYVYYAGKDETDENRVPATGETGTSWFENVEYDTEAGTLTITLANSGTPLVIPVVSDFSCIIYDGQNPVDYNTAQIFSAGEQKEYSVRTTGVVSAKLSTPQGWKASLSDINETGEATLTVTAPASASADALTKVTADTEKDITIHALNKDGLSLFAKMQVETVSGPVPSISLSAGDATFNTLTFNVTPNENVTSYKYLLYKSGTTVPTDETSFADAQEVKDNLSAPLTIDQDAAGASLDFDTEYTLYVLPVNTGEETSYGRIASATASTTVPATNSELYEATGSITIAGVTYDHDTYGDATVIEATDGDLEIKSYIADKDAPVILFLKGSEYKYTLSSTTNITSEIIIIGDDVDNTSSVELNGTTFIKLIAGSFVMKNIALSSNASPVYIFNNADATANMDKLHFDGCHITVNKNNLLQTGKVTSGYTSIKVMSSTLNIANTATNTVIFNYNNCSVTDVTKEFVFDNNIVYSASPKNIQILNYANATDQTGNTWEANMSICNNTIYNVVGANVYVKVFQIATLKIQKNIFWADPTYDTASYCLATYSSGQTVEGIDCSDNIAYGLTSSKNWATTHSNSTVKLNRIEKTETDPLSVKDTENGIFTPVSEYSSYGAQR